MKEPHNGRTWLATIGLLAIALVLAGIFRHWSLQSDLNSRVPEFIGLALLAGALYLIGVHLVEKFQLGLAALIVILAGALVFRLCLLPLDPPPLSDDIYRYQWEGRVQRAGLNPYTVTPATRGLERFEDPAHPLQTARDIPTVYPPLSELSFSWVATVAGYKRLFTGLDLATVAALLLILAARGKPLHRVLTYAWNPTTVVAFSMCGHHDSLAILTLIAASFCIITRHRALAFLFLALSFLAKFFPAVLLPVFIATVAREQEGGRAATKSRFFASLRCAQNSDAKCHPDGSTLLTVPERSRRERSEGSVTAAWAYGGIFVAVVLTGYLPYLGAGRGLFAGLSKYAALWEANDSLFRLLLLAGNSRGQAKLVAGVALLGLVAYVLRKRMEPLRACLFLIAGLLLLSSNAFPWYFTWSIPLLCFYPSAPWLLMSVTAVLGYAPVVAYAAGQPYVHSPFILTLEYAPVYLWLAYEGWRGFVGRPWVPPAQRIL